MNLGSVPPSRFERFVDFLGTLVALVGIVLVVTLIVGKATDFGKAEPFWQRPAPNSHDPDQYPGQSSHAEPPEGWMCEPRNQGRGKYVPPDHACTCQRMEECADKKEERGVTEDNKCTVWCWPKHCTCPIMKCDEGSM